MGTSSIINIKGHSITLKELGLSICYFSFQRFSILMTEVILILHITDLIQLN